MDIFDFFLLIMQITTTEMLPEGQIQRRLFFFIRHYAEVSGKKIKIDETLSSLKREKNLLTDRRCFRSFQLPPIYPSLISIRCRVNLSS